ncbi:arylamine N-acetyltransferase [Bacillus sp. JJ1609]|uniref:arylamine N-acetyltransferase family protein n=1 Tax=Bacillus sp. JJ1609 TaxID=3122977 RepID=UPI00300035E3
MRDLNYLFRQRIGFSEDEPITLDNLDCVLERTAAAIPFENLCAIAGDDSVISEDTLMDKIFMRNEGGLCYELNGIFYLFLKENGLDVQLIRGAVYVSEKAAFSPTGSTHAAILLTYEGKKYIVDTGFGGNLPLKPVPMDGTEVSTPTGEFRVVKEDSQYGDYFLEMKLKNKDTEWRKGYAFDSLHPVKEVGELTGAKKIITEHPQSPFNKKPLLTRVTVDGSMILTEPSFIWWKDGQILKEEIDAERFKELARVHFKIRVC